MKRTAIIATFLAVVVSTVTQAADWPTVPEGASAVPIATSGVVAPAILGK